MELPVYLLDISEDMNDDAEVDYVALVDRPAIQKNWNAFKNQQRFEVVSEDKHIISGPLMLADVPIFRSDATYGDYYVVFSKDTIFKIAQKFFKRGYQSNVNLMHSPDQQVEGVTMFESFITDASRGIQPMKGFEDAPDGSWFGSFKVENESVWNDVKDGKFKGFSVEGLFTYKTKPSKEQEIMNQVYKILEQVNFGGPGSGRRPEGGGDKETIINVPTSRINVQKEDVKNVIAKAKESGGEIDKLGKDLASKYGGVVTPLNYKSEESITRKVNNDYGGNINELKDSVRNTVIIDNEQGLKSAIKDLTDNPSTLRVKVQNHESDPLGYSGTIANVKMSNGLIGEVQVNSAKMIYAKENEASARAILGDSKYNQIAKETGKPGGLGHKLYEEYRLLDPKKDAGKMAEIANKSKKYYNNFRG